MKKKPIIAIIGLGYVGLPLAVAFATKYKVIGFDINLKRVTELQNGHDTTLEISDTELKKSLALNTGIGLKLTDDPIQMIEANVYIITVPTPTNKYNQPVLTPLQKASETVGEFLKKEG